MFYSDEESNDESKPKQQPHLYEHKVILAPMVRENSLAFRLLCLKYDADLVYTEEIIDYRLCECRRLVNKVLGTIDFVDERGEIVFRTCEQERDRVILQMGSNNPERALKAARLVEKDVLGIDFNFGCPKSFSISGGMGAAMLEKPDQIEALLKKCVKHLHTPITCKIRILPSLESTLELVKRIESCGVSAIAVHARTKDQRPHHENQNEFLKEIAQNISIPLIANGGSTNIKSYSDILKFKESVKASSVMIARAAMKNPSIFKPDNVLEPIKSVIEEFIKLAVKYDNYVPVTKYAIQSMLPAGHFDKDLTQKLHSACDFKMICETFGLADWYEENKIVVDKSKFYTSNPKVDHELEQFINESIELLDPFARSCVFDTVPYVPRLYGSVSPKAQLSKFISKLPPKLKPMVTIVQYKQYRYFCLIEFDSFLYLNKTFTNSKRQAEQATTMLVCENLGLVNLKDYRSRTNGSSRNIH